MGKKLKCRRLKEDGSFFHLSEKNRIKSADKMLASRKVMGLFLCLLHKRKNQGVVYRL